MKKLFRKRVYIPIVIALLIAITVVVLLPLRVSIKSEPSFISISLSRVYADSYMPTFRSAGAKASGTGAVTPALPASMASGDICILVGTTVSGGTITMTATGSITTWTALTGSPIDPTTAEKIYIWWGRWTSGTTGPTLTPGGDHACAGIAAWYNCIGTGSPIDVSATGTEAISDTSYSFITGLSTSLNNEMVIDIVSSGADSNTGQLVTHINTNLSSITTRMNYNTTSGGGGGFSLAEGRKATAGTIGTWSGTMGTATYKGYISFALKPSVIDILVSPTFYNFSTVTESSTPSTTTNYFSITNTSNRQTDQTISVTTTTWSGGVAWTHNDSGSPGTNAAALKANRGGTWGVEDVIVKNGTPNYIYENCPASTNYSFGLELLVPTSFSDGVQKQIIVRITAVAG